MSTLPFKLNQDRRPHIPRQRRKVTNWPAYDASLRQRGSLTIWFTEEAIAAWRAEPRPTRGGQPHGSALAIRMTLVAIVDGIERLPGIGAKTALAIRVELGRIALLDVQSP